LGAKILGNIEIGEYSRVGAGSVVLKSVPPGCTAVGVPAKLVNCAGAELDEQDNKI
jgi:serine O-acetyltransferase